MQLAFFVLKMKKVIITHQGTDVQGLGVVFRVSDVGFRGKGIRV